MNDNEQQQTDPQQTELAEIKDLLVEVLGLLKNNAEKPTEQKQAEFSANEEIYQLEKNKNAYFIQTLLNQNILTPGLKDKALAILNYASQNQAGITEYSEGQNLQEQIKDFLQSQPPLDLRMQTTGMTKPQTGEYSEIIRKNRQDDPTFPDPYTLHNLVLQYQRRFECSYDEAFKAVCEKVNKEISEIKGEYNE